MCRLLPFLPKAACDSKINTKQRGRGGGGDQGGERSRVNLQSHWAGEEWRMAATP